MNEEVFWILECAVRPNQLENLKELMEEMVAATMANESGALNYQWFMSPDSAYCHLFERYADSAATVQHLQAFREQFAARFMDALEVKRFMVYGQPDDAARKALGKMGARIMEPLGGFTL
jgi:quinol monooxygenase YgiN